MLQVGKLQALVITCHVIQVITAILYTVTTIQSVNRHSAQIPTYCYADKTVFLFTSTNRVSLTVTTSGLHCISSLSVFLEITVVFLTIRQLDIQSECNFLFVFWKLKVQYLAICC